MKSAANLNLTVKAILKEELEYFNQLVKETKYISHQSGAADLNLEQLEGVLRNREQLIEALMLLEEKRKKYQTEQAKHEAIRKQISDLAFRLVKTDATILDTLQLKKKKIAQEMAKMADIRNRHGKGCQNVSRSAKHVDIRQE